MGCQLWVVAFVLWLWLLRVACWLLFAVGVDAAVAVDVGVVGAVVVVFASALFV